jgi:Flp pilus assembly pilin Flp
LFRSRFISELDCQRGKSREEIEEILVRTFVENEAGLTMVEYAAAGALVTSAAVDAFTALGGAAVARITFLVTTLNT